MFVPICFAIFAQKPQAEDMKATLYISREAAGAVLARFRLTAGRNIQLYHTSDIRTTAEELRKFNADGTPRKRVAYCRELMRRLQERLRLIEDTFLNAAAAGRVPSSTKEFNALMREALNPDAGKPQGVGLLEAFRDHCEMPHFSEARRRGYRVTLAILERFCRRHDRDSRRRVHRRPCGSLCGVLP